MCCTPFALAERIPIFSGTGFTQRDDGLNKFSVPTTPREPK